MRNIDERLGLFPLTTDHRQLPLTISTAPFPFLLLPTINYLLLPFVRPFQGVSCDFPPKATGLQQTTDEQWAIGAIPASTEVDDDNEDVSGSTNNALNTYSGLPPAVSKALTLYPLICVICEICGFKLGIQA